MQNICTCIYKANFGLQTRRQPLSTDVNHSISSEFNPKVTVSFEARLDP